MKKSLFFILLATMLIFTLLPTTVFAEGNMLPTGNAYLLTENAATVYFGIKNGSSVAFRAVNIVDSNTLRLISSEATATNVVFGAGSNVYATSNLRTVVDSSIQLTVVEDNAIKARTLPGNQPGNDMFCDGVAGDQVITKLWAPTTKDAGKLKNAGLLNIGSTYWLCSPGIKADYTSIVGGSLIVYPGDSVNMRNDVRVGFDLDLTSVLFASAATGGKSNAIVGGAALTSIAPTSGNELKLTVRDSSRNFSIVKCEEDKAGNVKITYKNASVGDNEYLTYYVLSASGTVIAYAKIAKPEQTSGTVTFAKPSFREDQRIFIISEQANGNRMTDYASTPVELNVSREPFHTVHTFSTDWTTNEAAHWHICITENCGITDYSASTVEGIDYGAHTFSKDSICEICGYKCQHSFVNSICKFCGYECEHFFDNGICKLCGYRCAHVFDNGVCLVCGYICPHSRVIDHVCSACGKSLGHVFTGKYIDNWDGTHSRKCLYCEEYGNTEKHSFGKTDHKCVCGKIYQPEVKYLDYVDGAPIEKSIPNKTVTSYVPVTTDTTSFKSNTWYVVTGSVKINSRIENQAGQNTPAYLILLDGCTLTAPYGIHNGEGNGLVIYGQSAGTGLLTVSGVSENNAGIGGGLTESGGDLTINGGTINVRGGTSAAGIGSGNAYYDHTRSGGNITINGGTVTANGGAEGAGIGGGDRGAGGNITINGGKVTAVGTDGGAGIGGGNASEFSSQGAGGHVRISGGEITAIGSSFTDGSIPSAAIGPGGVLPRWDIGGTVEFGRLPAIIKGKNDEVVDSERYCRVHSGMEYVHIQYVKAEYQVKHMLQKEIRGSEFELKDTETLQGYINNMTEAAAKNTYSGYRPLLPIRQQKIAETGTVVEIQYDLIYSTITFDTNGIGTALEPIYAAPGTPVAAPSDPSEEGFVFRGWYTDKECTDGHEYTFSTMPEKDITVHAKWITGPARRQDVQYVDEDGNMKTVSAIMLPANQKNYVFEEGEWYALAGDATIENRIMNQAPDDDPAHLILTDGCQLTAKYGIECESGKSLSIYGQSEGSGTVRATGGDRKQPGIGGSGHITINGGTIIAIGGKDYNFSGTAGIGVLGGSVTINGGTVTATGASNAGAGIGTGETEHVSGSVTINGGTVTATGGKWASGIGSGGGGGTVTVTINGGTVTAVGGEEADGIGVGLRGWPVNITINGGEITATGGAGKAGIGGDLSFSRNPVVKAGADKDGAADVETDTYKADHQNYHYVHLYHQVILTEIEITTAPAKTVYTAGESFDPNGMVVTATYSDGSSKPVIGYDISPSPALSLTDTTVEIRYTENGVTKTVKLIIQVNPTGPVVYKVIIGMNQTIFTNSVSAKFASNADFSKFDHVEVDGKTVAKKYYAAESGSTVITFNRNFIKTLSIGEHKLTIVSKDGNASTGFTVSAPLPSTGDSANPAMLLTLLLASMGTVLLMAARAKKRNED